MIIIISHVIIQTKIFVWGGEGTKFFLWITKWPIIIFFYVKIAISKWIVHSFQVIYIRDKDGIFS